MLGDSPAGLKEVAAKALTDVQKRIRQTVAVLGLSAPNQQLNNLRDVITAEIESAIQQIRGYDQTREMMTADNMGINSNDGLMYEGEKINAYIDTYFDVDKRFGLHTKGTDSYINLYADYDPADGSLSVYYILHDMDDTEHEPVSVDDLTIAEQNTILQLMRDAGMDDLIAEMDSDPDEGMKLE